MAKLTREQIVTIEVLQQRGQSQSHTARTRSAPNRRGRRRGTSATAKARSSWTGMSTGRLGSSRGPTRTGRSGRGSGSARRAGLSVPDSLGGRVAVPAAPARALARAVRPGQDGAGAQGLHGSFRGPYLCGPVQLFRPRSGGPRLLGMCADRRSGDGHGAGLVPAAHPGGWSGGPCTRVCLSRWAPVEEPSPTDVRAEIEDRNGLVRGTSVVEGTEGRGSGNS